MNLHSTLQAATGWLELGLADEALLELNDLPAEAHKKRQVLEVKLAAQMTDPANKAQIAAREEDDGAVVGGVEACCGSDDNAT